jgi:hypothetical protein
VGTVLAALHYLPGGEVEGIDIVLTGALDRTTCAAGAYSRHREAGG